MKLAIVGCGAIGSYYGACLCRDGQDVHFLLRSDYETVRRRGVEIRSPNGNFRANPKCAREPEEIGAADLVLVALKTTANAEFTRLIPPLVGAHTVILTLQNGLGNEEQLAAIFGPERILGGLCFVCLNRLEPGVVAHMAHGKVVLGEFQRPSQPRTRDLAGLFRHAGIPCEVTENLERTHWEKLVWNIPFNGLGVAGVAGYEALANPKSEIRNPRLPVLPTDKLLGDPCWQTVVRELMLEVIAVANAKGLGLSPVVANEQIERTRGMGAYKASTLLDFERGQPLELDSLFLKPLAQAHRLDVPVPRLEALCRVLRQLDPAAGRTRQ